MECGIHFCKPEGVIHRSDKQPPAHLEPHKEKCTQLHSYSAPLLLSSISILTQLPLHPYSGIVKKPPRSRNCSCGWVPSSLHSEISSVPTAALGIKRHLWAPPAFSKGQNLEKMVVLSRSEQYSSTEVLCSALNCKKKICFI